MDKNSFYGTCSKRKRDAGILLARLARREKQLKETTVPKEYKSRVMNPCEKWRVFHRQQDAFDFARSVSCELQVIAYESEQFWEKHGQRMFLVTSYDQFWHYYSQLRTDQRHHYEVIAEGAACRLYFDLEFPVQGNQGKDGDVMTDIFIKYVIGQLKFTFDVNCNISDVLRLDASTSQKYSCHLIFRIPGVVFKDNINAGYFVQHICDTVLLFKDSNIPRLDCGNQSITEGNLLREEESNVHGHTSDACERTPAVRENSKNPNTATKTQMESSAEYLGTSGCRHHSEIRKITNKEGLMKHCGLTEAQLASLFVKTKEGKEILFCDLGVYTKNRTFRFYLSCKLGKSNPLVLSKYNHYEPCVPAGKPGNPEMQLFLDSIITNVKFTTGLRVLTSDPRWADTLYGQVSYAKPRLLSPSVAHQGYAKSPYPEVDDYITANVINTGGVQGHIRHWVYFSQGEIITYDIGKNRWCDNIGRPHKSNNIIIVADLKNRTFYQKCHDPDCRAVDFKSSGLPLPTEVLPSSWFSDDDDDFGVSEGLEVEDDELVNAVDRFEQGVNEDSFVSDEELLQYASHLDANGTGY